MPPPLRFYVWRDDDDGGLVTKHELPRLKLAESSTEDLMRAVFAAHARPLQYDPLADMRFVVLDDGTAVLVGDAPAAVAMNPRDPAAARRVAAAAAEVVWREVELVGNPKLRERAREIAEATLPPA